jgi:uncharacterized membrane protein
LPDFGAGILRLRIRDSDGGLAFPQLRFRGYAAAKEPPLMKAATLVGIVLVVLGILALAYQGFTYTKRDKIVDIGPIHATADTQHTVSLPPVVGGLALVGGIVLIAFGARK